MKLIVNIFMAFFILFLVGCNGDVKIKTSKKGEGPVSALVTIYDSGGKNIISQNSTDSGGKLVISLEYGKYKIKSSLADYDDAIGEVKVDLFGAMFGIDVSMPMSKKKVAANILEDNFITR
ncbi:MAG: hypothetical protein GX287_03620 [Fusobacteria bacterium]|jgi:hypothetical protein|nr:hypothetical protein [Fusobacteriota bacterium]